LLELSKNNMDACGKILKARQQAQGFVFGLFVDLVDLCRQLRKSNIYDNELKDTCAKIEQILEDRKGAVVANELPDQEAVGGGLSIYFPYRLPDPTEALQELRVKGSGTHPTKGSGTHPTKERIQRIHELERDFAELKEVWVKTGWLQFIQEGWCS